MDRHIILTLGRSGSNTLVDMLNQHPNLYNLGEVLGPWTKMRKFRDRTGLFRGNTAAYVDHLTNGGALTRGALALRNLRRSLKGTGVEVKSFHSLKSIGIKDFITLLDAEGLLDWVLDRPDVKVIGLVRDNVLDRLVSWQRLAVTNVVAATSDSSRAGLTDAFEIDPSQILSLMEVVADEVAVLETVLEGVPADRCLRLRYEDFYGDMDSRSAAMSEVFHFLRVPDVPVHSRMQKIITVHAAEMIANRAACAEALRGSRFEGALDLPADRAPLVHKN